MSTDLTPSTTNSTDKRLYEYTDEDLWALLESRERKIHHVPPSTNPGASVVESPPWWSYSLTNGVFYIKCSGGNDNDSSPADLDLPLRNYDWFSMELWDYREMTEEMKKVQGPEEIKYEIPGFPEFFIKMEVHVWPHLAIDPRSDDRFKEQDWAKRFNMRVSMGHMAHVTPPIFGEIVRYCDKNSGLKAFW